MTPPFPPTSRRTPFVKICGITRREDAERAIRSGADALGFNFWPRSKRFVAPEAALEWIGDLPAGALRVAVLVDPDPDLLETVTAHPAIDALQLHGSESPAFAAEAGRSGKPILKAVPLRVPADLDAIAAFDSPEILIECSPSGEFGGTGTAGDWALAGRAVAAFPEKRLILAGGLHPGNVCEAIRRVRPFGVDVATGVESEPGIKDPEKLERFLRCVREAGASSSHG